MTRFQFSPADVALFSAASHDRNPLHMSADYARRSPFGTPVVFGVLGGLVALGALGSSPGRRLKRLTLGFQRAILVDEEYLVEVLSQSDSEAVVILRDGTKLIFELTVGFESASNQDELVQSAASEVGRSEAADLSPDQLKELRLSGFFSPDRDSLSALMQRFRLADAGFGISDIGLLLFCSYLVGMELPGRRALFHRLSISDIERTSRFPFEFQAHVESYDERFDLLRSFAQLSDAGRTVARIQLEAFVRSDSPMTRDRSAYGKARAFDGKIVVVVGASRGLGAAIAESLVLSGATVFANYHKSLVDMERLRASVNDAKGQLIVFPGDASDPAVCESIQNVLKNEFGGRLDLLVCNACPPIRPLFLEPEAVPRILKYIRDSVAMVANPMASLLSLLAGWRGCNVVLSSSAVTDSPTAWPHYVAAKQAIEGLTKVAAQSYPDVRFLIMRPSRLSTDLTNTPGLRGNPMKVEQVVARLLKWLSAADPPQGNLDILDDFRTY